MTGDVIGWDIGGVNTKVARVSGGRLAAVVGRPYELQRDPNALVPLLRELAAAVHPMPADAAHAVTMTAELSQLFRTKREGVHYVLDAIGSAFPPATINVFTVDGGFLSVEEARRRPLDVAAANWAATARVVAAEFPDAILIDIGTTSTDIIPIAGGMVKAVGRTDPERLASGELVYTGAVRTPAEAMAARVPFGDATAGVSAEGFALSGDVHVWRGTLAPADYTWPPPDGRPPTREFVRERLARVICADRDILDDRSVSAIADALADAQVARVATALRQVVARHRSLRTAVVTGLGAFIAAQAAKAVGLEAVALADTLGDAAARCAPAASVALLFGRDGRPQPGEIRQTNERASAVLDIVVKLGGSSLADVARHDAALRAIETIADEGRTIVVPGGGPFADAVRNADLRLQPGESAAHWMAILGMDQHAHLIASRLRRGVVVASQDEAVAALAAGSIPVLAPYRWLRAADPLPHSWTVTSDSIAAWVAGTAGARRLILIKPAGATGDGLVDGHFARVLPKDVALEILRLEVSSEA
jgi:probable H4MPT-linked C1 transfer pathway protein